MESNQSLIGKSVTLTVKLNKKVFKHKVPRKGRSFFISDAKSINGETHIALQEFEVNQHEIPYFPLKFFCINHELTYDEILQVMADSER